MLTDAATPSARQPCYLGAEKVYSFYKGLISPSSLEDNPLRGSKELFRQPGGSNNDA